jgi:hypothetical protein
MNIELKKLKVHEDMSEETTAFSAEVWSDGQLVAYAKNIGQGGETDLLPAEPIPENRARLTALERTALSLPPVTSDWGPLPMNLPFYIDMLASAEGAYRANKKHGWLPWSRAKRFKHDTCGLTYPEFEIWGQCIPGSPLFYPSTKLATVKQY